MNQLLLDSLRRGGYILYARHGEATAGEDQSIIDFQNCFTQRNLSELGRRQAIYYGEMLRYLRIPISYPISTSPFCRAVETAQWAFGSSAIQVDPFWIEVYKLSGVLPVEERNRILATLQTKLEVIPPEGRNQVIVAHGFPGAVGLGQITNMGTVVVRPLGRGKGYEIVRKLSLSELAN